LSRSAERDKRILREGFTRKNTAARPVEASRAAVYMKG